MATKNEVTQGIDDRPILVNLSALQHMGMVTHHQIRPRINGSPGDRPLVGSGIACQFFAPVEIHHHPIHLIAHGLDICRQGLIFAWVSARAGFRGRVPMGVVIAKVGNPLTLHVQDFGATGFGDVFPGPDRVDVALIQGCQGVQQTRPVIVHRVVVGQRHQVNAPRFQGGHRFRFRTEIETLARSLTVSIRNWVFQIHHGHIDRSGLGKLGQRRRPISP